VCCSVLQCVAVRCSVLQCVAVRCSVLQCVAVCCSVLQCGAGIYSALQRNVYTYTYMYSFVLYIVVSERTVSFVSLCMYIGFFINGTSPKSICKQFMYIGLFSMCIGLFIHVHRSLYVCT